MTATVSLPPVSMLISALASARGAEPLRLNSQRHHNNTGSLNAATLNSTGGGNSMFAYSGDMLNPNHNHLSSVVSRTTTGSVRVRRTLTARSRTNTLSSSVINNNNNSNNISPGTLHRGLVTSSGGASGVGPVQQGRARADSDATRPRIMANKAHFASMIGPSTHHNHGNPPANDGLNTIGGPIVDRDNEDDNGDDAASKGVQRVVAWLAPPPPHNAQQNQQMPHKQHHPQHQPTAVAKSNATSAGPAAAVAVSSSRAAAVAQSLQQARSRTQRVLRATAAATATAAAASASAAANTPTAARAGDAPVAAAATSPSVSMPS